MMLPVRGTPNTYPGKSSGSCTAQIPSWSPGGNSRAGSPTATQPIGTVASGASPVMFEVTPDRAYAHDKGDPFGQTNYSY